jgi:elongator complex protein 3
MTQSAFSFDPQEHRDALVALLADLRAEAVVDTAALGRLVRRHPRRDGRSFTKNQIIHGLRAFAKDLGFDGDLSAWVARLRMKPIRTLSGVAPVTVLTKPFPCPGQCIFCPNDVRMPKSYLAREPGAQRATQHAFDPYGQVLGRLITYHQNGHLTDKVELIVLGGTWSFYPETYQLFFIKRCFDALNDFKPELAEQLPRSVRAKLDFESVGEEVHGEQLERTYNEVIGDFLRQRLDGRLLDTDEHATWDELEAVQERNEKAESRCVGLVLETRPDHVDLEETLRLRRLGCTKVQLGVQSLTDAVLEKNRRGHLVAATRQAMAILRRAAFKLHVHLMPNLYGADPESDAADGARLFADRDFRPDELKLYPCSLIESAELMQPYRAGLWRPYSTAELADVLEACLLEVPEYCRVTRMIRDIPGDDILDGNKITNFREVVEHRLAARGLRSRDIRAREIRDAVIVPEELRLEVVDYESSIGREFFFQVIDPERRIAGFSRLSLPTLPDLVPVLPELVASALLREVHVYGGVVGFGAEGRSKDPRSQHLGLGRRLVEAAAAVARDAGYADLAVIAAIGTRDYYRGLGFVDGALYQHLDLRSWATRDRPEPGVAVS